MEDICFERETEPPSQGLEPPDEDVEPPSSTSILTPVPHSFQGFPITEPAEIPAPHIDKLHGPARNPGKLRALRHRTEPTISPRADEFRQRFFPDASTSDWSDWRWQLRNRIQDKETLARIIHLTEDESLALANPAGALPLSVTPYYASLLNADDFRHAVRRAVVPVGAERLHASGEAEDPLCEENDIAAPGIVHRYPDRVLFLVTEFCSTYCRYCTRSRMVGKSGECRSNYAQWEQGLDYISRNPSIRDVLLSGGDPLTLSNERLEWLLTRLQRIPHVEFVRIGTKVPAVLPQRVTLALTRVLRRHHPLWMSLHFTHPDELTPETAQACARLADAGVPLGSQTVLLAGVNDDVETMRRLFHGLLKLRVKPYYLYQCDPIPGSSHFRTPVQKGLEIIRGLRGHTTGYAIPSYVIDAPGGGGKIPLLPDYLLGRDGDDILMTNYEGKTFRYPDYAVEPCAVPPAASF